MMKRLLCVWVLWGLSAWAVAQEVSFSVAESGTGRQAVVFIPGFACSGDVWQETVEALEKECTCYVLTMAGFAGIAPEEHPSFEGWKEQIARFIRNKRLEKPILVGHSMGGGLALAVAADYPGLLRKVVVVDALPCLKALTVPGFTSSPRADCTELVDGLMAVDDRRFEQMQRMSAATLTTDTLKCAEIASWGVASDRKTYAEMFCDFSNTDLRERVRRVSVPSLVLLEPSFRNIATSVREQYKHLSGVRIEYAGKGLHFLMFDDKEWFLERIREFITER